MKKNRDKSKIGFIATRSIRVLLRLIRMSYFLKLRDKMTIGWYMNSSSMSWKRLRPFCKRSLHINIYKVIRGIIKGTLKVISSSLKISTIIRCHWKYFSCQEAKMRRKLKLQMRLKYWRQSTKSSSRCGMQ